MAPIAASSRYTGGSGYGTIPNASRYTDDSRDGAISPSSTSSDHNIYISPTYRDHNNQKLTPLPKHLPRAGYLQLQCQPQSRPQKSTLIDIHKAYLRILKCARTIIAREKSVPTSETTISVPTPKTIKVSNDAIPNIKDYILPIPKPTKKFNFSELKPTQYPQRRK